MRSLGTILLVPRKFRVSSEFAATADQPGPHGDPAVVMPAELEEQVRDALTHLYDPASLQTHPLLAYLGIGRTAATARGKLLRQALLDAIAALYPGNGVEASSRGWRACRLLELRYLEDQPVADVMAQMSLSKTQYHREHQRALRAVSSVLWDQRQSMRRGDSLPAGDQSSTVDTASVVRREAATLASGQTATGINPAQICLEVIRLLEPLCQERGVALRFGPDDNVPAVDGDRVALRHALLTILTRALTLTDTGIVEMELACTGQQVGIRIRGPARGSFDSSHLGIEESRVFVEALHGRLQHGFSSAHDGQWEVTLTLPAKAPRTLLVVDNDVDFIRLVQRFLAGSSWVVLGASSVEQARHLLERTTPRAVLLDIVMPGQDGWDALITMKASAATQGIPVVVCSAFEEPRVATSLGALAALQKPITQQQLLSLLSALD